MKAAGGDTNDSGGGGGGGGGEARTAIVGGASDCTTQIVLMPLLVRATLKADVSTAASSCCKLDAAALAAPADVEDTVKVTTMPDSRRLRADAVTLVMATSSAFTASDAATESTNAALAALLKSPTLVNPPSDALEDTACVYTTTGGDEGGGGSSAGIRGGGDNGAGGGGTGG
jgi:hypothetical protein